MSARPATNMQTTATPRVFIVDDDAAVRAGLSLLVRACGWDPHPCASAGEFLDSYTAEDADCLLLDLQMPGMTGIELQQALAARGLTLPVIVVTAHADDPLAERSRAAGARAVVAKPFRNEELVREIRNALPAAA